MITQEVLDTIIKNNGNQMHFSARETTLWECIQALYERIKRLEELLNEEDSDCDATEFDIY